MSRWHRHLDGWQLGVAVVGSALVAAALGVPRAVTPREVPLPGVDRLEEARLDAARRALVASAHRMPLPFLVRAAGEAMRRFGDAEARNDVSRAADRARDVALRVREARAAGGDAPLLALRAVQTDLFLRAVTGWADTGKVAPDLAELGGTFVARARQNGWVTANGRLALDPDGVASIFVMRWTKLSGLLETYPFSPSLNEWRLYFRTLLSHPEFSDDAEGEAALLSSYVTGLCRRDPEYPELLARGVLEYRLGNYGPSVEALAAYLQQNPAPPAWLRARNYLIAAHQLLPVDDAP